MCASITVPDLSVTRVGSTERDHLAQQHLDVALLQLALRVGADVGLEHRQEGRAGLDEDDPGLVGCDPRVVLGEVAAVQLGQRAGALDAGGPAADDDDVERAVRHQRRVLVGGLPPFQQVVLEPHGVGEGVHREAVLGGALDPEELDAGAERQHEVVVGERGHVRELHLALRRGRCRSPPPRGR